MHNLSIRWWRHNTGCSGQGIALVAGKGRIGEMYFLCGEPQAFREIFACWSKKPGAFIPRMWLPVGLAAGLFAPLEPFLLTLRKRLTLAG